MKKNKPEAEIKSGYVVRRRDPNSPEMHLYLYDVVSRYPPSPTYSPFWAFTSRVDRAHMFPTQKAARLANKDCDYPREEREIVHLQIQTTQKLIKKIPPPALKRKKKKKKKSQRIKW